MVHHSGTATTECGEAAAAEGAPSTGMENECSTKPDSDYTTHPPSPGFPGVYRHCTLHTVHWSSSLKTVSPSPAKLFSVGWKYGNGNGDNKDRSLHIGRFIRYAVMYTDHAQPTSSRERHCRWLLMLELPACCSHFANLNRALDRWALRCCKSYVNYV